jgi:hypothetical protein
VNLALGIGFAVPTARVLDKVKRKPTRLFRYFVILVGLYFVECVAVVMGMGIPVLNIGLAFLWGIVFGRWLRARTSRPEALRTSFWVSLYSSLPAVSFILVPVFAAIGGWNIVSATDGVRFGIPEFLHLPWPVNTILGFYGAIIVGAAVLKVVITVGEVSSLCRVREKSALR